MLFLPGLDNFAFRPNNFATEAATFGSAIIPGIL